MSEIQLQPVDGTPLQATQAFVAQLTNHLFTIQQALEENVRLRARVAELESDNAALNDTLEEWKNNNEWANRVTYSNVVEQIASLEDASKRDDARRMIEALLKKQQVTQFRRDIKRRVRELNDEGDTYNDEQVTEALEACVGKGRVVDTKWKWAAVHWYLRWVCNYPVDAKEFCARIQKLELDIPVDYECCYENIRKYSTLTFMNNDPRWMDGIRVSKNDQTTFSQCREIVIKLGEELEKTRKS